MGQVNRANEAGIKGAKSQGLSVYFSNLNSRFCCILKQKHAENGMGPKGVGKILFLVYKLLVMRVGLVKIVLGFARQIVLSQSFPFPPHSLLCS